MVNVDAISLLLDFFGAFLPFDSVGKVAEVFGFSFTELPATALPERLLNLLVLRSAHFSAFTSFLRTFSMP